jgi:hypothetical protein
MKSVGLICDTSYKKSVCFSSFYHATYNLFKKVKLVNSHEDLKDIDYLFIGNEHFIPHKNVWNNSLFIDICNSNKIDVFIFSGEKIFNSFFPHNTEVQKQIEKFTNLYQYVYDAEDVTILQRPLFRPCLSKDYAVNPSVNKKNKACFIGNVSCGSYKERNYSLQAASKIIEIDLLPPISDWNDYIRALSEYKFVFNPLGNAYGFNFRFYETLTAHSIPIQQIKTGMLKIYDIESSFKDCIYFDSVQSIVDQIDNINVEHSYNKIWLEDHIKANLSLDEKIID